MGVGFHLSATYPNLDGGQSGDDWLADVAAWVEAHETEPLMVCRQAHCDKGEPALFGGTAARPESATVHAPTD